MSDVQPPTVESCRALGHRIRRRFFFTQGVQRSEETPCYKCEDRYRRATCDHGGGVRTDWGGILGWRHHCDRCGELIGGSTT